jgi:cation:H+ antiporter
MIPALAGIWSQQKLPSTRDLIYKEIQFYLLSIAALLLMFSFAVIYNPVGGPDGPIAGEVTRGLVLFPLALYGFYVFLQYQDTMDYQTETPPESMSVPKQFGVLLVGLLIILVGVEGLVRSAIGLGDVFGTPSFLWGITVVAAGTSVPDAFVSVRAAQAGNAVTSVANVLGSNVFDLLVCIPAGVLVAGTAVVNYSVGAPMMGVLTLATLIVFMLMRSQMVLTTTEAWGLIGIYLVFVVWISVETFGAVNLLPNLPPAASVP